MIKSLRIFDALRPSHGLTPTTSAVDDTMLDQTQRAMTPEVAKHLKRDPANVRCCAWGRIEGVIEKNQR